MPTINRRILDKPLDNAYLSKLSHETVNLGTFLLFLVLLLFITNLYALKISIVF